MLGTLLHTSCLCTDLILLRTPKNSYFYLQIEKLGQRQIKLLSSGTAKLEYNTSILLFSHVGNVIPGFRNARAGILPLSQSDIILSLCCLGQSLTLQPRLASDSQQSFYFSLLNERIIQWVNQHTQVPNVSVETEGSLRYSTQSSLQNLKPRYGTTTEEPPS